MSKSNYLTDEVISLKKEIDNNDNSIEEYKRSRKKENYKKVVEDITSIDQNNMQQINKELDDYVAQKKRNNKSLYEKTINEIEKQHEDAISKVVDLSGVNFDKKEVKNTTKQKVGFFKKINNVLDKIFTVVL